MDTATRTDEDRAISVELQEGLWSLFTQFDRVAESHHLTPRELLPHVEHVYGPLLSDLYKEWIEDDDE